MRRWAAGLVLAAMTLGLMAQTGRAAELELAEEKPRTFPPRLSMADSKLRRVRVLGS